LESMAAAAEKFRSVIANRLFVFDMDGTLLSNTTACIEIARATGTLDQVTVLEQQFAAGEIDAFRFAQQIAALWGLVDRQIVRTAFKATPKLRNIEAVTARIRNGGGISCLITMSPDFYAHLFYDYGFDFIEASEFPRSLGEELLPAKILNPEDKAVIVRKLCQDRGLEMNRCVAFGDSMSDYLLFRELQHTVSVNGDPTLQAFARYRYDGLDLQDAFLAICNQLLNDHPATERPDTAER
jgi:phosphoserine phosphatase